MKRRTTATCPVVAPRSHSVARASLDGHAQSALRGVMRRDQGMTLAEVMVALTLIVVLMTSALVVFTRGVRTQAKVEREDQSVALAQQVISRARHAQFGEIGFYKDDYAQLDSDARMPSKWRVMASPVTLPVTSPDGTEKAETGVLLGDQRPDGTIPFTLTPADAPDHDKNDIGPARVIATDTRSGSKARYLVMTTVTWTNGEKVAKRVTVIVQRGVLSEDGSVAWTGCGADNSGCVVQSTIRAATASDYDPVTGATPKLTCQPGQTELICDAYARSGRVLDGATMATAADLPEQTAPVDLYLRTSSKATEVKATWTFVDAAGRTVTKSATLEPGADGTRWAGVIKSDSESAAAGHYKGEIRPGSTKVTFNVRSATKSETVQVPVFWSYGPSADAANVKASLVSGSGWCSPEGGVLVTFEVSGHSIGFKQGVTNTSAKDTVDVVFTSTDGTGKTTSTRKAATLVSGSVQAQNVTEHDVVTGGYVKARWQVAAPKSNQCGSRTVTVILHRAIDATDTPVSLRLPTANLGALSAPTLSVAADQDTGRVTASWNQVTTANTYKVEWTVDPSSQSPSTETRTVTGTSVEIPNLAPGHSLRLRVATVQAGAQSGWAEATVARATAQPVVSTPVPGDGNVKFVWTKVEGATGYEAEYRINSGGWKSVESGQDGESERFSEVPFSEGQTVEFRVRTVSLVGDGEWSQVASWPS